MNAEIKGKDVNMDLRGERGLKRLVFFFIEKLQMQQKEIYSEIKKEDKLNM